jgi:hypothetical protein
MAVANRKSVQTCEAFSFFICTIAPGSVFRRGPPPCQQRFNPLKKLSGSLSCQAQTYNTVSKIILQTGSGLRDVLTELTLTRERLSHISDEIFDVKTSKHQTHTLRRGVANLLSVSECGDYLNLTVTRSTRLVPLHVPEYSRLPESIMWEVPISDMAVLFPPDPVFG